MDVTIILKIAGIGILVASAQQILSRAGRDDHAMLVSLAGIVIVILMLLEKIREVFATVRDLFGI